jgi:hypothetical protein
MPFSFRLHLLLLHAMDEKVHDLFIRQMGLKLDKRKEDAAMAAMRVRSESSLSGALQSSRTALGIRQAYEEIYDDICLEAWLNLHHIAVTIGVEPNDNLVGELRSIFDELMMPLADQYLEALRADNAIIDNMRDTIVGDAETSFARSRDIVGTEIELFSSNTAVIVSQSKSSNYIQNYNFSGPVGAFQQGDNTAATVTQNIDTAGLEALRGALDALLEKFANHDQLAPLITEAKAEAAKPQPVMSRLQGLFSAIKVGISILKDGKELFDAAETAALECGMDTLFI